MATQQLDLQTQRSVLLEGVKAGEVAKFERFLKRIDRLVREQLTRSELTTYSRDRLEEFLSRLDGKLLDIYKQFSNVVQADLVDIALYEAGFEARALAQVGIDAVLPADAAIKAAIWTAPLQVKGPDGGKLLKAFLRDWTRAETVRVTSAIRIGFVQGQTNAQMVQTIRGTAAANFTDGVLAVSNRNARSVVNTAVQAVATAARMETAQANKEVVLGVRLVATLDRKTSTQCKTMDGLEYPLDSGPRPPFHVNCRTTFILLTRLTARFLKGATRASVGADGGAQVSAGLDYYQWLKTQPAWFQDQALGPVRGKLFRDGGLTAEAFAKLQLDSQFRPITLKRMKELEPEMFKQAGIG